MILVVVSTLQTKGNDNTTTAVGATSAVVSTLQTKGNDNDYEFVNWTESVVSTLQTKGNDKLTIKEEKNRIDYEEITSLYSLVEKLVEKEDRNAACHFNLPNDLYEKKVKEIERKFINAFIKPGNYENYGSIPPAERGVLDKLLDKYHNNYYKCKTEKGKQREEAENRYFEGEIKGSNSR